jgi:hypothetical protein
MQAAHREQEAALPGPHDGPAARGPHVAPFENGRQVARQGEEGPGAPEQGQRHTLDRPPESPRQPAILQQRDANRERRRLGRHHQEVPHPHWQRAREGAREGGEGERGGTGGPSRLDRQRVRRQPGRAQVLHSARLVAP